MIEISTFSHLTKSILCFFLALGLIYWNRRDVKRWKEEGDGYLDAFYMARNFKDWVLIILFIFLSLFYLSKY